MSWAGEKSFDPKATVSMFRVMTAIFGPDYPQPELLKLASVMRTSCLPGMGRFSANSQCLLSAICTESFQF